MALPLFLDVESGNRDDHPFPTSVAWSLPDGSIKSVIVCPDDDWNPQEYADPHVDLDLLYDQGVSGPDVIREINEDLSGQTVFVDGLDDDETLVDILFSTYQDDPDFEMTTISDLFDDEFEAVMDARRALAEAMQLNLDESEDSVRVLVHLANDYGV